MAAKKKWRMEMTEKKQQRMTTLKKLEALIHEAKDLKELVEFYSYDNSQTGITFHGIAVPQLSYAIEYPTLKQCIDEAYEQTRPRNG